MKKDIEKRQAESSAASARKPLPVNASMNLSDEDLALVAGRNFTAQCVYTPGPFAK